ncbi:MAG TPA: hypothetical protein VFF48_09790 [Brevundimonas sp.]|nr:hypothetical protein [Brevundimonas sp.]
MTYDARAGLSVATPLTALVEGEILPGLGIEAQAFWTGAAALFARFTPLNRKLLGRRDELQVQIDAWHEAKRGLPYDPTTTEGFLREIGYLVDEPASFAIGTEHVDDEVARMAGPQLVVPILNARFVLNAANARWGSLYDALYGTDALGDPPPPGAYDAERGRRVVAYAKSFLDQAVPLAQGRWADLSGDGKEIALRDPAQFVGRGERSRLFRHNGLLIEVVFDPDHPVGRTDPAGVSDVVLEAALSTIVDLEDSVAAVDGADKAAGYRNWLGLMKGDLSETFAKDGRMLTRELQPDRTFTAPDGSTVTLPGRSLLFVRNVGHLMTTPAVLLPDGSEAPEGVLDAVVTALIGLHDRGPSGRAGQSTP